MKKIKKSTTIFNVCKKPKGKFIGCRYRLTKSGCKFAHDVTCKCKVHITDSDKAKGVKPQLIKITCIDCGYVNQITQRNSMNTTVWETSDNHIIVSG